MSDIWQTWLSRTVAVSLSYLFRSEVLFHKLSLYAQTSLVAQMVKHLSTMRETWVRSLGWEDPLEKEMAIHSSTIAWKIPWTEELGSLQSMGLRRVRHDWATSLHFTAVCRAPLYKISELFWLKCRWRACWLTGWTFLIPSPLWGLWRCAHSAWRPCECSCKPHLEYAQDWQSKLNIVLFSARTFKPICLVHNGACKTLIQMAVLCFCSQFQQAL